MKKFLLATVSMVALSGVARGADMPAMPAKGPIYSPVPATDWSGLYLGVQGGVVRRDTSLIFPGFDTIDGSKTGGTGGAVLGYSWQQGSFVYGLEGDWNWIGAKASHSIGQLSKSFDTDWLGTIRGRAGLALDATLFYLTGGVAFGHLKNSSIANNISFIQNQIKAGWTLGAGIEHMLAPNWTARAEFRYADLGRTSGDCVPGVETCGPLARADFSNALMMGLVGVNYKFGGGRAADWSQAQAYVPPSISAWAGSYLGIQGGIVHHDAFFNNDDQISINATLIERKKIGGTAGALAGYNWQRGTFVYGVEGDWSWIGAKTGGVAAVFSNENMSNTFNVDWLATLRGRAGLALDATLAYVTGGVAFGHTRNNLELIGTDVAVSGNVVSFTQNQTKIGWTAGVGVEHVLSQHWTARAEFRYVDLGTTSVACASSTNFSNCLSQGYRGTFSNTLKLGLIGLNYKF